MSERSLLNVEEQKKARDLYALLMAREFCFQVIGTLDFDIFENVPKKEIAYEELQEHLSKNHSHFFKMLKATHYNEISVALLKDFHEEVKEKVKKELATMESLLSNEAKNLELDKEFLIQSFYKPYDKVGPIPTYDELLNHLNYTDYKILDFNTLSFCLHNVFIDNKLRLEAYSLYKELKFKKGPITINYTVEISDPYRKEPRKVENKSITKGTLDEALCEFARMQNSSKYNNSVFYYIEDKYKTTLKEWLSDVGNYMRMGGSMD
ncbi:MAG: hypothetical protein GY909_15955 [Oligoflexia bacterium]|nr:hypothetical protein [Oligoflexia bacterium]